MRTQSSKVCPDIAIAELARRQHGVVSRAQLLALGLQRGAIQRRLTAGRLHPIRRGVYAVGHRHLTQEARWLAAVLACGEGAVLSHLDAAALWQIRDPRRGPTHITIPVAARRTHPGVRIHRRALESEDKRTRRQIPVTSPARTVFDLAALLPRRDLERAIEETLYRRLLTVTELQRRATAKGGSKLGTILAARQGSTRTRSKLEELFLKLCIRQGLPEPETNIQIAGLEVDFLWRSARLIVETDGYASHGNRAAFERDHHRDVALDAAGYAVRRFTYRQVTEEATTVATVIRRALSERQ